MSETTLNSRVAFQGRLLTLEVHDIETHAGVRSSREIVRHPGAAASLARLPDGRWVFVRQYRKPVEASVLEIVAGVLHPGENPDDGIVREIREETGYAVADLVKLGVITPSPGYTDEQLHLYIATLGEPGATDPDDDEHVEVVVLTGNEVRAAIRDGNVPDGKTLAAWALYSERFSRPD